MQWAAVFEGGGRVSSLAVDEDGNSYIAFTVYAGDNLSLNREVSIAGGVGNSGLAKFNPQGGLVWSRTSDFGVWSMAENVVVGGGAVFLAGETEPNPNQRNDGFLTKYSATGDLLWRRTLPCTGRVYVQAQYSPIGRVELSGGFTGTLSVGNSSFVGSGGYNVFVASYSMEGNVLGGRQLIGTDATVNYFAVGEDGSRYLQIAFEGSLTLGTTSFSSLGNYDVAIVKLDPLNVLSWARQIGGTDTEEADAIAVTSAGEVVLAMNTWGPGFTVAGRRISGMGFWTRLDSQGVPSLAVEAQYAGGTTAIRTISTGHHRDLLLTSESSSSGIPTRSAVCSYSSNGTLLWSLVCESQEFTQCYQLEEMNGEYFFIGGMTTDGPNRGKIGDLVLPAQGRFAFLAKAGAAPTVQALVTTIAGSGTVGQVNAAAALEAQFNQPNSPAISPAGVIFVADTGNHAVRFITPGGAVGTFAGGAGEGWRDGTGLTTQFRSPLAVAFGPAGQLLVADSGNHGIRRIVTSDVRPVSLLAGRGIPGSVNGSALSASFDMPNDLVSDPAGNLFITEFNNHVIRRIDPAGNVSVFAGSGSPGYADGRGAAAQFNRPAGIALGADQSLYVTDWGNHRVRKILPDGTVRTLAGTNTAGRIDGLGAAARLDRPDGIVVGADGRLYVADYGNNAIRAITPAGHVLTIAGQGTAGFRDGLGGSALFNGPCGIALHPDGSLIVTETGNHRVRRVRPDSTPSPPPDPEALVVTELHPALSVRGRPGSTVRLESAPGVAGWQAFTNVTLSAWEELWVDPQPAAESLRLYRPVVP